MFRTLIIAATLLSGAAFAHDADDHPASGRFVPHFAGTNGDGQPEIHRPLPSSHDSATAGPGRLEGGADDSSVTRTGPGRGTLGSGRAAIVTGNEDGRPVIVR